ncbi:hypothetical protein PIB30_114361, partial [Stylosanthes scabra]|nr:hypothetical protein [Stylosanthes scabra]
MILIQILTIPVGGIILISVGEETKDNKSNSTIKLPKIFKANKDNTTIKPLKLFKGSNHSLHLSHLKNSRIALKKLSQ